MAEGTYEYECMRAELLGKEKPDYNEFLETQKVPDKDVEEEELDVENLKEAEVQMENLKGVTGKLDELNSILSMTQKKINNFKYRCGSVTSYMRTRLGSLSSAGSLDSSNVMDKKESEECAETSQDMKQDSTVQCPEKPIKSDLARALDNHVDKLDSLLDKAETAQYAMENQRKQMKRFLK